MKQHGFTLGEITVVIASTLVIAFLTIPVGVHFYRSLALDDTTHNIASALHRANANARYQKNDVRFGVAFFTTTYVLFQGASYAGRNPLVDETMNIPGGITVSGIPEIVFGKTTGIPSPTGIITVSSGGKTRTITINSIGLISQN